MTALRAIAPAKVNLGLAVTGRRSDGYHELRTIFLRLVLGDELSAVPRPDADRDSLEVIESIDGAVDDNLVLRAAADLRGATEEPLPYLHFTLRKHIPIAAGLGGGSSDAAAAMELALTAWRARLHPTARLGAAMRLGADVPFFASGYHAALGRGIGERLISLPTPTPAAGLLLVTPAARLSTAAVFAELDSDPGSTSVAAAAVDAAAEAIGVGIDGPGLVALSEQLRDANDLWGPATRLSPALLPLRETLEARLGRAVLLTGSGPTLFAIYPSGVAAAEAAQALKSSGVGGSTDITINSTSTSQGDRT